MSKQDKKSAENPVVTLGKLTVLKGLIKFSKTLRVQGRLEGAIEAPVGNLIVEKGATVDASRIEVTSLTVFGKVVGNVFAHGKVDMMGGSIVQGDVVAAKLRIADGVLFKGQCSMTGADDEPEIFSRPIEDIKAELERIPPREL